MAWTRPRYWFPVIGYNYRMTNIAAAIGLAQLERMEWQLERRLEIAALVPGGARATGSDLAAREGLGQARVVDVLHVLDDDAGDRDEVMDALDAAASRRGRSSGRCMSCRRTRGDQAERFPVAERSRGRGINLPTWAGLSREQVDYVCEACCECLALARQGESARLGLVDNVDGTGDDEADLLVTGSNGLIGSEMVEPFPDLGWEVHGVDNNMRADFFGPQGDTRWNQQRLLGELSGVHPSRARHPGPRRRLEAARPRA